MTNELDAKVLKAFLENQKQLFPEPVAETAEEAGIFRRVHGCCGRQCGRGTGIF